MTKRGKTAHLTIRKTKFVLRYRWKCGASAKFCVASKFEIGNVERFEDTSMYLKDLAWQKELTEWKKHLLSHIKMYDVSKNQN